MLRLPSPRLPTAPDTLLAVLLAGFAACALWAVIWAGSASAQDIAALERELDQTLSLTPNLENGRELYDNCVGCHGESGWSSGDGAYPQIAGQHRNVIIKQIVDIRFGLRDNPDMLPFVERDTLGGPQALADIAGYVSSLPMNSNRDFGPGTDLARGEDLFERKCSVCHLFDGEGEDDLLFPKIVGQNYLYMLRELNWMKEGKRRNAFRGMVNRIKRMPASDLMAVADYVSRLKPRSPYSASEQ